MPSRRPASVAFLLLLLSHLQLTSAAHAKRPARVFQAALEQIQSQTHIPILLPSRLPSLIREADVKLAEGTLADDGYFISLYFSETRSEATFAAGFGGSRRFLRDLPNTRRVALRGGRTGMFSPVSCGGSCAPANLQWEQSGMMYQIQVKLQSDLPEHDQERILVETANSSVIVRRK